MSASPADVRSLFAAARADAPDDVARDEMWSRVATATGIAATTAVAASASATASATPAAATTTVAAVSAAPKLLAIGALIGMLSTAVGVLIAAEVMQPGTLAPASGTRAPARPVRAPAPGARLAEASARPIDPAFIGRPAVAAPVQAPSAARDPEGDLAEEARLVTDARAALVAGDPTRALTLLRGVRRLSTRALEPEELGLEARALRALGRADEAAATELRLKSRFPGHALAR